MLPDGDPPLVPYKVVPGGIMRADAPDPPLVPHALPLAEVRATMRGLRTYLDTLYPTARELLEVGIDHIEAACDEMEGVPDV